VYPKACDDSHLPVVQAGNLGTSYTPRAKKSLHCAAAWCTVAPWTWLLPPTIISWYATYDAKVRDREGLASTKK
jgi:hypothetical protein